MVPLSPLAIPSSMIVAFTVGRYSEASVLTNCSVITAATSHRYGRTNWRSRARSIWLLSHTERPGDRPEFSPGLAIFHAPAAPPAMSAPSGADDVGRETMSYVTSLRRRHSLLRRRGQFVAQSRAK